MPIVDARRTHPYGDTPSPKRLGTVSPLDPEFFLGMDEFADELLKGGSSGKYSPAWVANRLDEHAETASARLHEAQSKVRDANSPEFRRLAVDVTIQAGLGKFFAAKFRAGVLFVLYERSHYQPALETALKANRAARAAWAELAGTAKIIYRDDITFGPDYFQRGHWLDRLPAMDADITDMEKLLDQTSAPGTAALKADPKAIEQAMRVVLEKPKRDEPQLLAEFHTPPPSFRRDQPLTIIANTHKAGGLWLRYRHVNQAETWQMVEMELAEKNYRAVIPADYTDSPFPLQYHFQIRASACGVAPTAGPTAARTVTPQAETGVARLHPGLQPGWRGQPYFVVRQA
jgi:hypothetical protein